MDDIFKIFVLSVMAIMIFVGVWGIVLILNGSIGGILLIVIGFGFFYAVLSQAYLILFNKDFPIKWGNKE